LAPGTVVQSAITFVVVASGTIDTFNRDGYRAALASALGTSGVTAAMIELTVEAASVRVTSLIRNPPAAASVFSRLQVITASPQRLSGALGIPIASIASSPITISVQAPLPPSQPPALPPPPAPPSPPPPPPAVPSTFVVSMVPVQAGRLTGGDQGPGGAGVTEAIIICSVLGLISILCCITCVRRSKDVKARFFPGDSATRKGPCMPSEFNIKSFMTLLSAYFILGCGIGAVSVLMDVRDTTVCMMDNFHLLTRVPSAMNIIGLDRNALDEMGLGILESGLDWWVPIMITPAVFLFAILLLSTLFSWLALGTSKTTSSRDPTHLSPDSPQLLSPPPSPPMSVPAKTLAAPAQPPSSSSEAAANYAAQYAALYGGEGPEAPSMPLASKEVSIAVPTAPSARALASSHASKLFIFLGWFAAIIAFTFFSICAALGLASQVSVTNELWNTYFGLPCSTIPSLTIQLNSANGSTEQCLQQAPNPQVVCADAVARLAAAAEQLTQFTLFCGCASQWLDKAESLAAPGIVGACATLFGLFFSLGLCSTLACCFSFKGVVVSVLVDVHSVQLDLGEIATEAHRITLARANKLYAEGEIDEATPLYREVIEMRRQTLGDRHPDTLTSIHNLGRLLTDQGRLDEAAELLREALEARRQTLGHRHPDTLASINELGRLLKDKGELDEAAELLREAMNEAAPLFNDALGDLDSFTNMGMLLKDQDKLEEAEPLWRESLLRRRATLGDRHASTLVSINNLGLLLQDQAKLDEAEPLLRESLEGSRATRGNRHPDTLASMNNLGRLLHDQDQLGEAETVLSEALVGCCDTLSQTDRIRLRSQAWLADVRRAQGNIKGARALVNESLIFLAREALGDTVDTTLILEAVDARLQHAEGGGLAPLKSALERMRAVLGPHHSETRRCEDYRQDYREDYR
jgi:tetratricopeptide (TPR) repeat protein